MTATIKIGLYGIGLDIYWAQFEGLLERLTGYQRQIAQKITRMGIEVINAGLVDNTQKVAVAAALFKQEQVEMIFLYISTYELSSTVLPVVQKTNVPVVVLNLQPVSAIDYEAFNALGDRGIMVRLVLRLQKCVWDCFR